MSKLVGWILQHLPLYLGAVVHTHTHAVADPKIASQKTANCEPGCDLTGKRVFAVMIKDFVMGRS